MMDPLWWVQIYLKTLLIFPSCLRRS